MPYEPDYTTLVNLFFELVDSQGDKEIANNEAWKNDAQVLSIKLFQHLVSMRLLAKGITIENHGAPDYCFVDHSSIKVVARAALETYLIFYYIFCNEQESLSRFRHRTWNLAGLMDRQKYHTSGAEGREKQNSEKIQIDSLIKQIESDPRISPYSKKQKKQILKGNWKIGKSWMEFGVQAGFNEKYFENVYSYLCGYSHSSYASALQVRQAQSIDDQNMLAQSIMGIGVVIMAHFTFTYSGLFGSTTSVLKKNAAAVRIAEKWRFGAADMADIFDG